MTYDEAIDSIISKIQARTEIELHGHSWVDFIKDIGDREEYTGAEVLDWLGY